MERHVDYAVSVARKLQRERLKSIEPKKEAVKDFDDYLEAFFKIVSSISYIFWEAIINSWVF